MFRLARLDTYQFSIAPAPLSLVSPSQPSSGAWPAWESIFSWLFAFNLLCGPNNCLFFFKCNRRLVAATRSRNAGTQTTTWTSSPLGAVGESSAGICFLAAWWDSIRSSIRVHSWGPGCFISCVRFSLGAFNIQIVTLTRWNLLLPTARQLGALLAAHLGALFTAGLEFPAAL